MAVNGTGAIFLDRNGMLLFASSVGQVLQFNFAPNIIRDLEVINPEMLDAQIDAFFKQSGIQPFQGIIILSNNLLFEKPISPEQTEQETANLNAFIDNLPFDHVGSITYTASEPKYIATNKELYQTLIRILKKQQCVIDFVLPASLLETDGSEFLGATQQSISNLLKTAQSVKQFSFLVSAPPKISQTQTVPKQSDARSPQQSSPDLPIPDVKQAPDNESKSRLFLLLGVFGVLLVILGIAAFTML